MMEVIVKFSLLLIFTSGYLISRIHSVNVPVQQYGKEVPLIFSEQEDPTTVPSSSVQTQINTKEGKVRIVNDLVFFELGIYIDFSYNQTRSEDDNDDDSEISAPGCPKANEGRPWVYYGAPSKCVIVGFRGPCPWGQRIFQQENSNFGICNCDCFAIKQPEPVVELVSLHSSKLINYDIKQNLILYPKDYRRGRRVPYKQGYYSSPSQRRCNRTKSGAFIFDSEKMKSETNDNVVSTEIQFEEDSPSSSPYQFCFSEAHHRQVVYDGVSKKCYPFLDQGPCQPGEWLVKKLEDETIFCEKRKCDEIEGDANSEHGGAFTYFDYKRQECVQETYGSPKESFFHGSGTILQNRREFCKKAGMKYSSILKTCVKDYSSKIKFNVLG